MPYDKLEQVDDPSILGKLAVLKVNGGLGTSMGTHTRASTNLKLWLNSIQV